MEPIVNRVAQSEIMVFDLEALWDGKQVVEFDLAPFLFQGLIVREKEFRQHVKDHDWNEYADCHVAISCSVDTIIPTWAFLLVASRLESVAASVAMGKRGDLIRSYFTAALQSLDLTDYRDGIVVIKGCGSGIVPVEAYTNAMVLLQGVARKIMYGEACSSVPLWRRK